MDPQDEEFDLQGIDPRMAALQALAGRAEMGGPSEDAPVTIDDGSAARAALLSDEPDGNTAMPEPQPAATATQQQRYVNAPTTTDAYQQLPASAMPQQAPRQPRDSGGFDWGRALTAFGGGDVGAYDTRKNRQADAPFREVEQKLQLEQGALKNQGMRDDQNDAGQARKSKYALVDSSSPESMQMQEQLSRTWNQTAQMVPAQFADEFKNAAAATKGKSAAQLMQQKSALDQLLGNVFKFQHENASQEKAVADENYKAAMLNATTDNQRDGRNVQYAQMAQSDDHFNKELDRKALADAARAKAGKLRIQSKSVDKKAISELQDIDAMETQLQDVERELPKAMTGPGTDAALAVEGVAKSSIGKALGGEALFDALAPKGTSEALAASRTVQSQTEQAIAEMKLKRHGASFTASESAIVDKWRPGTKLNPEQNALLLSALRKYMATRGQQRVQQVYKETGMPIYIPPDKHLSLDDARKLKALYEGIDKYDDETAAGIESQVNEILAPYGGRTRMGSAEAPRADTQGARKAPEGSKPGQRFKTKSGKRFEVQSDMTLREVQ